MFSVTYMLFTFKMYICLDDTYLLVFALKNKIKKIGALLTNKKSTLKKYFFRVQNISWR